MKFLIYAALAILITGCDNNQEKQTTSFSVIPGKGQYQLDIPGGGSILFPNKAILDETKSHDGKNIRQVSFDLGPTEISSVNAPINEYLASAGYTAKEITKTETNIRTHFRKDNATGIDMYLVKVLDKNNQPTSTRLLMAWPNN
ncbi:hypothetical protein PPUJ20005_41940 [Pseudomonas putida]|uniref:hypothetical protein n=1 Tax=Pseudomonas TaxID=286 RepID=UPI00235D0267|nr:hypothetical protein [Pseudomonas putida]GLO10225.1 hypothetical protein PPUJ20005_41940 [Pseudomonas putida]HDS0985854.1 hypothetical protein [Pseudomonas putida]